MLRTQHGYQYDELGRLMVDLRQVDGKWYYNYTRYDQYGRVATSRRMTCLPGLTTERKQSASPERIGM